MTPTLIKPKDAILHFARERRCFRRLSRLWGDMIREERRADGQSNSTLDRGVSEHGPDAGAAGRRVDGGRGLG